jgi:hypothetical protein
MIDAPCNVTSGRGGGGGRNAVIDTRAARLVLPTLGCSIQSAEKSTARQASQLVTASRNHTTCPTDKEHLSHTSRNKQFDKQGEWGEVMFSLYYGV